MFQISEVDAADLSFGDDDFLDLDEPFSVNFSSELKQANIPDQAKRSVGESESAPVGTAQHPSETIKKFSFKSKQSSPPTTDGRPKLSISNNKSCSPTSLTSSVTPVTIHPTPAVYHKDMQLKGNVSLARGNDLQKKTTLGTYNSNMAVSHSQQTPKSQRFCWNRTNNAQEVGKARHNSGDSSEQTLNNSRSALQIVQKNVTCSNQHPTTTVKLCQSNRSNSIINSMNGPKANTPSLRNTTNSMQGQMSNNNNNNNGNLQSSMCTNALTSASSKLSQRRVVTTNNFSRPSSSKAQATARLQEHHPHHNHHEANSYRSISNNQRPNFQPHLSPYNPRLGTPPNRQASPRLFQGSEASRPRDNIAKQPEPVYSAAQTPHFTPRVAEMCRTPKAVKVMEKSRLRKFPGPAGILPKLNSGHGQKQFDAITPEPEENEDEKMDLPSSQCSAIVDDFTSGAWRTMLQVMDIDTNDPQSILVRNNIALVMRKASLKQLQQNKVAHLCVLLKTIHFNGSDASSILKDPTGEIQGTLHRKLMEDHKDELKPGCVLILRQVGVLSPSLRNHYLNITPSNLVHIFPTTIKGQQVNHRSSQPDSTENQQEPATDTNNLHLKEFLKQLNHEKTNGIHQQHPMMRTRDRCASKQVNNTENKHSKTQLLKTSQELTSNSSLVEHDSTNATGHAFKTNCTTINVTADENKFKRSMQGDKSPKRRSMQGDDKTPKRMCLESFPTPKEMRHENNSATNNDLGENIDELLQGIEDELFEDF